MTSFRIVYMGVSPEDYFPTSIHTFMKDGHTVIRRGIVIGRIRGVKPSFFERSELVDKTATYDSALDRP